MNWQQDADRDLILNAGPRFELLVRGEGSHLWDGEGRRYLDFLAGIAVTALGHAHPVFVEAVSRQAATLAHVSNYFATPPQLELAARLKRLAGAGVDGRVFFGNSGTEANEAAFKLARLHGLSEDGGSRRPRILSLDNAFHGRTIGALALTAKASMRDPFQPLPGGVEHIPATIEALESAIDDRVAALFVEPIQGEAGVLELPEGYLRAARALTEKHGALLIVDEIQTGAGRTGDWFGFQHEGIVPDAITLAKGIGGGFPIGALVVFGAAATLLQPGSHGSTFGGNPLATAVSNAVLEEIEQAGLVQNSRDRGTQLRAAIAGIGSPLVTGVRGRGLLIGVALAAPVAGEVVSAAQRLGLIVNAANPSSVRIAPALTIGDAEIAEFIELFTAALAEVAATALTETNA
ncbi:acetylornithine transaminase [Microbacterium panaciterrae]|uniref:Acetylornithine aminotransferase n=1 Tax=Microbacterium panaciterrae TaxID=985759 RepID=A0ABP8PNE5_9MICO